MAQSNASYHPYSAADAICRASRVPKRLHDPALLRLLGAPTSPGVISLIAHKAVETIQVTDEDTDVDMAAAEAIDGGVDVTLPSPPITPVRPSFAQQQQQHHHYQQQRRAPQVVSPRVPPLEVFIKTIVLESQVQPPTLLVTLVYLNRVKQRLPPHAKGVSLPVEYFTPVHSLTYPTQASPTLVIACSSLPSLSPPSTSMIPLRRTVIGDPMPKASSTCPKSTSWRGSSLASSTLTYDSPKRS